MNNVSQKLYYIPGKLIDALQTPSKKPELRGIVSGVVTGGVIGAGAIALGAIGGLGVGVIGGTILGSSSSFIGLAIGVVTIPVFSLIGGAVAWGAAALGASTAVSAALGGSTAIALGGGMSDTFFPDKEKAHTETREFIERDGPEKHVELAKITDECIERERLDHEDRKRQYLKFVAASTLTSLCIAGGFNHFSHPEKSDVPKAQSVSVAKTDLKNKH